MGSLVAGAALGTAFDLLFKSAFQTTPRLAHFSEDLNRLQSTLRIIKQAIDDVDSSNLILNRTQSETQIFADRLVEGEELLRKCAKVKRWNAFKRLYYSIKLSKLESSLVNFFQIEVAALHFRESKRISVVVSKLEDRINELTSLLTRNQIVRRCSNSFSRIVSGFEDGGIASCREITAKMDKLKGFEQGRTTKALKSFFYKGCLCLGGVCAGKNLQY